MANKYLNFDGLSHLIDKLKASIAKKVDKEEGKTLSSNDYTDTEKTKLAGIEDGAEVNVQSDWSQNDESADDYVKGRTHWAEVEEMFFVEEQTISGFFVMQEPIYAVENPFSFTPVVGNTYTVTWDGESYDCTAYDAEGMVCLGNEHYVGMMSGGDIPFAIIYAGSVFVATESTADSHTISIYSYDETVHQIDEKYIPDTIARTSALDEVNVALDEVNVALDGKANTSDIVQSDWEQNDATKPDYIKNRPFYEWTEMVNILNRPRTMFEYIDNDVYRAYSRLWLRYDAQTTYYVTLDNITYKVEPKSINDITYWGNASLRFDGEDTGEPFVMCIEGSSEWFCWKSELGKYIDIIIDIAQEPILKQLDEKFIPDTISRTAAVETALETKAEAEHAHEIADVTDLQTTLDGKANSVHAHEISDVNGLQTALDSKANSTDIVQSDWSQNDENSLAYIKNRTHYSRFVSTTIIDNQTYTTMDMNIGLSCVMISPALDITEGTVQITINNQTYSATWRYSEGINGYGCGNLALFGVSSDGIDEDLPFIRGNTNPGDGTFVTVLGMTPDIANIGDTIIISIVDIKEIVHQLGAKYIPDTIPRKNELIGRAGEGERSEVFNGYEENVASGYSSHAEGSYTTASGYSSHAEGYYTTASGETSHAEGDHTTASGETSHAEGYYTTASGDYSHAEGNYTTASGDYQHVQGKFNIEDTANVYAHIVGNGTPTFPSNAHTLDWNGNAWFGGDVTVGMFNEKLVTESEVRTALEGKIGSPTTASVGQIVAVKSVDVNGKPTVWEAVDRLPTVDDSGVLIF